VLLNDKHYTSVGMFDVLICDVGIQNICH